MSEILRAVGVMTVAGSALAVCLSALRPLLKNRLPKSAQYYLWLVVIAALLVPASRIVTLPVVINPVNSLKAVTERTEYTLTPPQALAAAWDSIGDAANGGLGTITVPVEAAYDGARETTELFHSQVWFALGSYAYPFGVLAVLLYFIIGNNGFLRLLRRRNVPAGIECRVPVYRNPLASTPMLIGVFRPAIVLPDKEYTDEQLEAVLRHELTHLLRRDILVRWLSVLACAVHWFNPIVWLTRREIDRACELSCDEAVIRSLDTDGKQSYGDTLLYVAAAGKTPRAVLSTTMCEDKKDLKERLGAIMKNRKYTKPAVLASAALLTAAVLAACALGAGSENGSGSDRRVFIRNEVGEAPVASLKALSSSDYAALTVKFVKTQGPTEVLISLRQHSEEVSSQELSIGDSAVFIISGYDDTEVYVKILAGKNGNANFEVTQTSSDPPANAADTIGIIPDGTSPAPEALPIPEQAPPLDVSLLTGDQVQSVRAAQLTRSWPTVMPNGEMDTIVVDTTDALHMQDYSSVTLTTNNESGRIALRWEAYPPQTVTVQRWNAIYEGTNDIIVWDSGEQISLEGHSFVLDDYGNDYIYEVYAAWPEGDSGYAFRVDSVGKKSLPQE